MTLTRRSARSKMLRNGAKLCDTHPVKNSLLLDHTTTSFTFTMLAMQESTASISLLRSIIHSLPPLTGPKTALTLDHNVEPMKSFISTSLINRTILLDLLTLKKKSGQQQQSSWDGMSREFTQVVKMDLILTELESTSKQVYLLLQMTGDLSTSTTIPAWTTPMNLFHILDTVSMLLAPFSMKLAISFILLVVKTRPSFNGAKSERCFDETSDWYALFSNCMILHFK